MIESVIISSSSVAPEIVPIGIRILVCLRFCSPSIAIKIIFDASNRSVFVVGARLKTVRLKTSGIIGFSEVVTVNRVVVRCILKNIVVGSILNVIEKVGVGTIARDLKNILNYKKTGSFVDVTSSSRVSSTGVFGRHSKSGTPPLIRG